MSDVLNICDEISDLLSKSTNSNIEVEVKIRNVSSQEFELFLEYLMKKFKHEKIYSIDMYSGEKRYSFMDNKYYETSKKQLMKPKFIEVNNKTLKFTVSEEKNKLLKDQTVKTYDFSRRKERYRFKIGNFYLDLTEVYSDDINEYTNEFEIEIVDTEKYSSKDFSSIIREYLKIFTTSFNDLIKFCNLSLSDGKEKENRFLVRKFISKPRDLLKKDVSAPDSILKNFTVSVKADGIPYFLIFHKMRIFLVSPKADLEVILLGPNENKKLDNSIFSGELVKREDFKDTTATDFMKVFLVYDTIIISDKNVSKKNYDIRFRLVKKVEGLEIILEGVKKIQVMEKKIFFLGDNSVEFYKSFNNCYQEKKSIFYKDDGYIFTPIDSPFVPEGQKERFKIKSLSKFLDVCKFKPIGKRSIDFIINNGLIYYFDNSSKSLQVFRKMKYSLEFSEDIEDKIVEFFPVIKDGNVVSLEPRRIRKDKEYPNDKKQVFEIYNSYYEKNPIDETTLLGKDTVLMRDYNNKTIKDGLISTLDGFIIDMGAGRGGDINKFGANEKIKKIISVEPNLEFAKEFKSRLEKSNYKNKFSILPGVKSEDTKEIIRGMDFFPKTMKGENLTITFMLSLTYFWESQENLMRLVTTIKNIRDEYKRREGDKDVKIIYYTINGYKVESFFSELGKNTVRLNTIFLEFDGKNTLKVDMSDSKTAKDVTEHLVKLDQLFDLLGCQNTIDKPVKVPENVLMSENERKYLSLCSYGTADVPIDYDKDSPLDRIPIYKKIGVEKDGLILAKGEDIKEEIKNIGDNFFRIGTLDFGISLVHSILKLISEDYRSFNVYDRLKMANDISLEIEDINDLKEVSNFFKLSIRYFQGKKSETVGKKYETIIYLNKCSDDTYEPIVYIDLEEVKYVFYKFDN